jgi:RNA polymerase sigma factor (sigma-70 family)
LNSVQLDIHYRLVEECKAGKRNAQRELYGLFAKAMYNICFRIMNDAEEANDMLQEAFIDAFTRIDTFRHESTFGAWLKRIVINKCINAKQRKKIDWISADSIVLDDRIDEQDSLDEEELQLSVERVKLAMLQLPEGGRMIFSLYMLEGYDHTEISQILNITESTSKTQFMRARNRIKELLLQMPASD